ncbi:hypothetical protein Q5H92_22925 [Hymenobacter sp. M29]|uniref:Uncharacterized protein n=1 Tax=Hymenobacter mellowenesis TaxID=3063995 RepID=A0ABT9AH85_9BACT|nr:hypothetical protein [Hymenobacter sp. M29]MDO7849236.1 hypothetical protein [Hymenobacter sp. M29]
MKACFLLLLLIMAGCAREAWHAPMTVPTDSTALLLPALPPGKYKFTGPVNITMQAGNNNVATPTATAKVKATAAAVGPGSSAAAPIKNGLPWWWLLVVVALALLILNKLVRRRWLF